MTDTSNTRTTAADALEQLADSVRRGEVPPPIINIKRRLTGAEKFIAIYAESALVGFLIGAAIPADHWPRALAVGALWFVLHAFASHLRHEGNIK